MPRIIIANACLGFQSKKESAASVDIASLVVSSLNFVYNCLPVFIPVFPSINTDTKDLSCKLCFTQVRYVGELCQTIVTCKVS